MNQQDRPQSVVALLLVLAIIFFVVLASMTTLGRFATDGALSIQPTSMPTDGEGNLATAYPIGTDSNGYLMTQKAVFMSTSTAIINTPYDTPVLLPTGTREGERVKFSGEKLGLDALNGWAGLIDGNQVSIYAGALLDDPDQGAIVIFITLPYRNFSEKILTPTKHGGVRILGEQNNRLILQAIDNNFFYFDVPARQFVSSLTEVVLTATPPPTYTPYLSPPNTQMPTSNPYPMPTGLNTEVP